MKEKKLENGIKFTVLSLYLFRFPLITGFDANWYEFEIVTFYWHEIFTTEKS